MNQKTEMTRRRLLTGAAATVAAVPAVSWMASVAEAEPAPTAAATAAPTTPVIKAEDQIWRAMW